MNDYYIYEYLDLLHEEKQKEKENKKSLPKELQKKNISLKNIPGSFKNRKK